MHLRKTGSHSKRWIRTLNQFEEQRHQWELQVLIYKMEKERSLILCIKYTTRLTEWKCRNINGLWLSGTKFISWNYEEWILCFGLKSIDGCHNGNWSTPTFREILSPRKVCLEVGFCLISHCYIGNICLNTIQILPWQWYWVSRNVSSYYVPNWNKLNCKKYTYDKKWWTLLLCYTQTIENKRLCSCNNLYRDGAGSKWCPELRVKRATLG